jgi:protein arginine kinase
MAPPIIEYEHRARQALLKNRRIALEDRIHRALAVLRAARLISSEETMYLLSHLRLGVSLGMVDGLTMERIGELALLSQPAHLQRLVGADLSPAERGRQRADMIRERLQTG